MSAKRRLWKLFGLALTGLALFFVVRILVREWPQIVSHLTEVRVGYLALGFLGFSGYFLLRAHGWQRIVTLFGFHAGFREIGRAWFLSEFKRYVPGSVWSVLGRVQSSQQLGHPPNVVLAGVSLEIVFISLTSLLLPAALLVGLPVFGFWRWVILAAIPILLVVIHPRVLSVLFRIGFRIIRKEAPVLTESLGEQLRVLVVYLAGWVSYGFGALFTSLAFVTLPTADLWRIFASFILAWSIGYVSLVTPMGLGIREGALLVLLGPILGAPVAGLLAVVTRLWIILTELAWVGFATTWQKLRGGWIERLRNFIIRRRFELILGGFVLAYVAYFSMFSVLRHENLNSARFDLGIMDQVVWNTAHGRILELTDPYGTATIHRFSIHFDPLLALFAPIYWVWSDPRALLVLQSLALGLGAIPVFLIARNRFGKPLSLAFASAYLLFPAMQWANTFDFHAVKFAAPLLLAAYAAAERRRYVAFTVFSVLAIMAKEEIALLVAMMGLWLWWKLKRKYVGLNTFVLSGLLAVAIIFFLMPAFTDGPARRAIDYYSQFGETPGEVVVGVLAHPRLTASYLFNGHTIEYLTQLMGPVGFFSIFQPFALALAWPEFAINLLSNSAAQKLIFFQYTSGITPFVFVSSILGAAFLAKKLLPWWDREVRVYTDVSLEAVLASLLVVSTLVGVWALSPLPGTKNDFSRVIAWKNKYVPVIREFRQSIPANASVSVTNTFGPHFTQREHVYSFPQGAGIADYVIVLEGGVKEVAPKEEVSAKVEELRHNPAYEVIREFDRLTVFRRK